VQKAEERNRDCTYSNTRGTIASRSRYLPCGRASLVPALNAVCVECLPQAASQGHVIAQAYLYRMFMARQKEIPPEIPMLDYLKAQARNGSRLALLYLKALEPQQAKHTREVLKYGYGGVGSNWFHENQWLQGLTHPKLMSKIFALDYLGSQTELQEVVVNIRGDCIIHAAAAVVKLLRISIQQPSARI
jgi:hypothetical protein